MLAKRNRNLNQKEKIRALLYKPGDGAFGRDSKQQ